MKASQAQDPPAPDLQHRPPVVGVLKLEPGDIVVISYEQLLSSEYAQRLAADIKKSLGDIRCVVLDGGAQLSVYRPAK